MKKSALIIGSFQSTETGYTGKLDTLAIKAPVQLVRVEDKEKDNHPDYVVSSGSKDIGVAWDYEDDRGHYVSIAFEEPSLAPGSYKLVKSGVEKGHTLTYRKPSFKKDGKK
ncbi:MAG TPA: DUF736 family protein [Bryobacteraceae bacterium]|jgi:uncharacterized protein (DUF736 family)|nr:DUF736 family protein [Bryobacteraceae bacterium]